MDRYDFVIVGAGMAGLSAGLYAGWLGHPTLVLERELVGGQVINADRIENFPGFPDGVSGADLITQTRTQALRFAIKTAYQEAKEIQQVGKNWLVRATESEYEAKAVIIASGGRRRALGIKGETELEGRGVSHCATCDGAFYPDKPVIVLGGGDTAVDEALFLTAFASKVTILHRGNDLDASPTLIRRAQENPKIEFILGSILEEICGGSAVETVRLRNVKTQGSSSLAVAGIFICVGFEAATGFLRGLVNLDPQGHVEVDLSMQTSKAGIFAAGYARQRTSGQLVSVAGDGVTAAVAAHCYIQAGPSGNS
ncbi:MAG: NAD(P)/FAD-dependent oxidoreductase [Candidatus Binatia bacterium]